MTTDRFSPFLGGKPVNQPGSEPMLSGALYATWSLNRLIDRLDINHQGHFACDCAERVIRAYESQLLGDSRVRAALDITRHYLDGQVTAREVLHQQAIVADIARHNSGAGTRLVSRTLWSSASVMVLVMNGVLDISPMWAVVPTVASVAVRLTENRLEREWQRRRVLRYLRGGE